MAVTVDSEKCNGCGACTEVCPSDALSIKDEKAVVDAEACIDCEVCVEECPSEALTME